MFLNFEWSPQAQGMLSLLEAHWDKVLRLVGSAPECASEVEARLVYNYSILYILYTE